MTGFPRGLVQSPGVSQAGLILTRSQPCLAQAFRGAAGGDELRATSAVRGAQSNVMGLSRYESRLGDAVLSCPCAGSPLTP